MFIFFLILIIILLIFEYLIVKKPSDLNLCDISYIEIKSGLTSKRYTTYHKSKIARILENLLENNFKRTILIGFDDMGFEVKCYDKEDKLIKELIFIDEKTILSDGYAFRSKEKNINIKYIEELFESLEKETLNKKEVN